MAVGMSVQMKSTVPDSTAMIMAGASSDWGMISMSATSAAWGRQVSYQMVPVWAVQVPVSWLMPVAEATSLPSLATQTMEA